MRYGFTAIAAAVLALALPAPVAAQSTPTVKREPITRMQDVSGGANFKAYCSVCHGLTGKGDGPAAAALKVPPADLTAIAKRHGGAFPASAVRMAITGDTALAAHGTKDMPTWGPVFGSVDSTGQRELRVRNLVVYIESIQAK